MHGNLQEGILLEERVPVHVATVATRKQLP
jgi:hypothetical protein